MCFVSIRTTIKDKQYEEVGAYVMVALCWGRYSGTDRSQQNKVFKVTNRLQLGKYFLSVSIQ